MNKARGWIQVMALGVLLGGAPMTAAGLSLTLVAQHNISNNFSPEFYEASGLSLAKNGSKLWSVGDENDFAMYKMELNGDAVSDNTVTPATGVTPISNASFEGVTYGPPPPGITDDHFIYLVDENSNSVVPVNYNTNQYRAPRPLSGMANYSSTTVKCGTQTVAQAFANAGNSGLEGITWNPDLATFFVIKEKSPGLMLQISSNLQTILACKVLSFNTNGDYSDIAYDSVRKKYWIVSDEAQSVSLYDWSTGTTGQGSPFGLTYDGGEGVAYDPSSDQLYICTDNGSGQNSYLYQYDIQ
ncbi:MAG: SdiA-regulated domain-containing protein [Acidobacteriota bacterium]